jgi:hypothetical protein
MGNKDEVVGVGIRQERMIHNETETSAVVDATHGCGPLDTASPAD